MLDLLNKEGISSEGVNLILATLKKLCERTLRAMGAESDLLRRALQALLAASVAAVDELR